MKDWQTKRLEEVCEVFGRAGLTLFICQVLKMHLTYELENHNEETVSLKP